MSFLIFVFIVLILYLVSSRWGRKDIEQFLEENNEPKESENIDDIDTEKDVLVTFHFLKPKDQFLVQALPNVVINKIEKHKITGETLTLKLPTNFQMHFGVPYMKREVMKVTQVFTFEPGYKYSITIKPKIFVFQKPKVMVSKLERI